jgi:hypothetical protein
MDNTALPDPEINAEQATLHQQLLDEFMNEQYFPQPHHFAARAEIRKLRARLAELEPKPTAKAKKADKAEQVK